MFAIQMAYGFKDTRGIISVEYVNSSLRKAGEIAHVSSRV